MSGRVGPIQNDQDQRGATLVETAMVLPLLLMILIGIVEFGLGFRDILTVSHSTQQSGRVGSSMGANPQSDLEILAALEQSLGALPNSGVGVIQQVHIYEADDNGEPKTGCGYTPGAGSSSCNVYAYAPGGALCDWSPCPDLDNGGNLGGGWTDMERDVALPGLDIIGVRTYYSHTWIIGGLFPVADVDCSVPPNNCWTSTSLFRLEPQVFEL